MSRLVIMVEGDLEKSVIESFLSPFHRLHFSSVNVVKGTGNGYFAGRFVEDVRLELDEADTYVLCLIDLYREPFGIYDTGTITSVEDGFLQLKQRLEIQITHRNSWRFAAFPVVREVESWLFAIPSVMRSLGREVYPAPETIPHPAQELKNIHPGYQKFATGKILFLRASAQLVYDDNCPHFKLLADWLKNPPRQPPTEKEEKSISWQAKCEQLWEECARYQKIALESEENLDLAIEAEEIYMKYISTPYK